MINDWVCINGSNYLVKEIKKNGVIKLYEDTKYSEHEIEFNADYIEDNIEPIPLTEEILDKNGFKKVEKDLFYFGQSSIGDDTWFGIDNNVIY